MSRRSEERRAGGTEMRAKEPHLPHGGGGEPPGHPRWIAHVDMDAFYASIEIRDDPSLVGKPVVVGGSAEGRGVVAAASYESRKFGIHSAMPMARALRLCPHLVRVPGDMRKYQSVSEQVMEIFARFSPSIEPLSLDEAFLDLTGTERIFGAPERVGRSIKEEIHAATRLTASVGIAPRKFVAKIASDLRKPDGLVVVGQDEVESFLSPLPIGRLWGVGPKTLVVLQGMGIETIGDLARSDPDACVRRLGEWGEHLTDLARGIDEREVVPEWEAKSYSHEETFARDRGDAEFIGAVMLDQASRVARRLRRDGVAGQIVTLKLRYGDFKTLTRQRKIARATCLAEPIYHEARRLFDVAWDGRPVRLIGVGVGGIQPQSAGFDLFTEVDGDERRRRLADTIDRIQDRFGGAKLVRAPGLRLRERGE
jgi:DNA polymerase IV